MTGEMGVALDLMRLEGICKMLLESLEADELETKFLAVTGQQKVENIKNSLLKLTKAELRQIVELSPAITESVIKKYYNEYRYGRKPGFVLFWASSFIGKSINEEQLKNDLQRVLSGKTYKEDAKFKDLKCVAATSWEESESTVFEIGLSYLKKYSFITADNNFDYIHELTDCFAWINAEKGFVALYNMPPSIEGIIKQAVFHLYGVKMLGLSLNRSVLDTIFDPDNRKKMSLTHYSSDSEKPQKATFSDPDLSSKQESILADYDGYDIASSLYSEGIDDDTTAILGINSHRGKLYINRNLTTTQFRQWSVRRINTIIDYFTDVFTDEGIDKIDHIQLFNGATWGRLRTSARDMLNNLAKCILICKQKGLTSYPISIESSNMFWTFKNRIDYCFLLNCDNCNETVIPSCPNCSKSIFALTKNGIICQSCGETVHSFRCECGHINTTSSVEDCLSVTLKDEFASSIVQELQTVVPSISLAENEFLAIHNGYLHIMCSDGYKRLLPKDIQTFEPLYAFTLNQSIIDNANSVLSHLKEKCNRHPTNEMCQSCKYKTPSTPSDLKCLQQLFCVFNDFTPKPHQGQEYGDISISVMYEGRKCNLQGIMKSQTSKITRSSTVGREITDQVIKGLVDNRTDIISVIVPALLDDQLIETLLTLARRFNKKLLFLDSDFMYRLEYYYELKIAQDKTLS